MVVSHGIVLCTASAHITNSNNERHTLYLQEAADDRDVGEQIVATAAAATAAAASVPAGVGQARDAPSGTSW